MNPGDWTELVSYCDRVSQLCSYCLSSTGTLTLEQNAWQSLWQCFWSVMWGRYLISELTQYQPPNTDTRSNQSQLYKLPYWIFQMVPASCSIWPIKICLIASSFISFFLLHHLRAATAKVDLAEAVLKISSPSPRLILMNIARIRAKHHTLRSDFHLIMSFTLAAG